jgi:hypothetical protein
MPTMPKKLLKDLKKSLTVKKPNWTITITNENVSLIQRKAFNVFVLNAKHDLQKDVQQTIFRVPVQQVREYAGIVIKDDAYLKEQLESLMDIKVKCMEVNSGAWLSFVLVGHVGVDAGMVSYSFSEPVRSSLIKNDYYTTLDLMVIKTFRSKYSVILYELAMRYHKVEIPEYDIAEFKSIMGARYTNFADFKLKAIDPAIKEINLKSDIELTYTTKTGGRGGKVVAIKFHIKKKDASLTLQEPPGSTIESQPISPYLNELISLKLSHKQAQNIIAKYPSDQIKRNIEYAKAKSDIQNLPAYLIEAIKDDYAKDHKPVDPKVTKYISEAKKCHSTCNGNCAAVWSSYKDNKAHICHYCAKFAAMVTKGDNG